MAPRLTAVLDWLQERLGTREQFTRFLDRRLPVGTTWWHTLGSAALFLILLQTVTGFFLAFYYVPSPEHAYDSLTYIQNEIPFGRFVRGLHYWGASFVVVVVFLHLLRVFVMGAYKYPREMSWIVGVAIFLVVMLFGFTGYLLPWDQKAYWATVVGTHIAGTAPVIGEYLWRILQGGVEVGARTLGRFYAAHVLILPAILYGLILVHLSMVIYQGIAPTPRGPLARIRKEDYTRLYEESKGRGETFFEHLLRDAVVAFVLVAALVLVSATATVPMEEVADPTDTQYVPRPEWYFFFLFELLWRFPGEWIPVATFWIPLAAVLLLFLLPFYDRTTGRHPLRRPVASGAGAGALALIAVLTYQGATAPLPPREGAAMPQEATALPPALAKGAAVYEAQGCSACHVLKGTGTAAGPDLTRVGARRDEPWLKRFIKNPSAVQPRSAMPPYGDLAEDELDALGKYLASLR
ncbi:MAG: cytochrome b N-terminal domain-containing protein [Candidatus Rokubacteria bacterium]|nr:cytochrome b N-terminal domain-containing protein [Candidatus Rokubacteria bacterium]